MAHFSPKRELDVTLSARATGMLHRLRCNLSLVIPVMGTGLSAAERELQVVVTAPKTWVSMRAAKTSHGSSTFS